MATGQFAEVTLERWEEIHAFAKTDWIYRGQREASWPLQTSLERCFNRRSIPNDRALEVESDLLREFRRAYHHYSRHIPAPDHPVEWLSLMQHHGAPTRLLDLTYSIYVASYFAVEAAEDGAAVWAVNARWALKESVRALISGGKEKATARKLCDRFKEGSERIACDLFFKVPFVRSACPINPFYLNERLRIQKGVFLIAGSIEVPFTDNLAALPGHEDRNNVLKVVIPRERVEDALVNLFHMNISRTTLFPGLDGYAQALGVMHPSFKKGGMLWCVPGDTGS